MTYSELRASDAERERVVAFLREHALVGRLTDDELEERIGLAYAAVTVGDLERLIADLPRAQRQQAAATRRGARPSAERRPPHRGPGVIVLAFGALLLAGIPLAMAATVAALGIAVLAAVFALSVVLGPFLLVALLVIAATRRHRRHYGGARWRPQY